MRASILLTSSILAVATGCAKHPRAPSDEEVRTRATAAIAPFKSALKGELEQAMSTSIEDAIDVCARRAPELARAHSKDGLRVGRSAERIRNPANAPAPWLAPVMARLAKAPSGTDAHEVVALEDGRRGYAEAIWLGPQCLACHGEGLSPAVATKIDARYPTDAARGFKPGEFRGVFWAELDAR